MKMFLISKGTEALLLTRSTGEVQEWTTRKDLSLTDEMLVFDRVRMSNGQVLEQDWGQLYGQVQRWCEQTYMGFAASGYILIVKSKHVATFS